MDEQHTKNCVIYCRVSTKEQAEEGNSLITQQRLCREYAATNGYTVSGIYIEQGESAKTADRTELKKLISYCTVKKNQVRAVIVYKIDRLSRNTDDYSQIRMMLKRYEVEIKSISEYFEDTPAGRFMENIIANVAQFDNDVRAERCAGGMKEAVKEGRYVWMAPYGYSNVKVNGKSTIAPNELAKHVQKVFERVATVQLPLEELRQEVAAHGLKMPNGSPMSKSNFHKLVRRELYCGVIKKFGAEYEGSFEPILSKELFYKVQEILTGKKTKSRKAHNIDFPLRRFLYHPQGKAVTGCWAKGRQKKYPYYMVHGFNVNIRKELLEETFASWLDSFKFDIRTFEQLRKQIRVTLKGYENQTPDFKQHVENQIRQVKEKQSAIINKNLQGIIPDEICREKLHELHIELHDLSQQIIQVAQPVIDLSGVLDTARKVLLQPGKVWKNTGFKQKVLLQSFYFPDGIAIDKSGSRTPKVCKLLKLKSDFDASKSLNVDLRKNKSNTLHKQISLPWQKLEIIDQGCEKSDPLSTIEIIQELSHLAELMKSEGTAE
jgi:site-specific DNA recombinase